MGDVLDYEATMRFLHWYVVRKKYISPRVAIYFSGPRRSQDRAYNVGYKAGEQPQLCGVMGTHWGWVGYL